MASSTPPRAPAGMAEYNVRWMENTFRNRKTSESLLTPELENGNLNRSDYERIMKALPGAHYSELMGFGTSAVGAVLYSHFKPPPKIHVGLIGYLVGETLGKGLRVWTHRRCFLGIENVHGFTRAMDNIKRKVGYSPGLISITRPLSSYDAEETPFQKEFDTPYGGDVAPVSAAVKPQTQPAAARSRWDEIRAARQTDGPTKSWDYVRQGRRPDGTPMRKQKPTSETQNGESWSSPYEDRAVAQANFDAMLEKERRMSTSSKERNAVW
ncbi:hypothetical protein FB45DRAFT_917898 [Roridomyces roridus]|uniref:Uncharacterized protein n=1 Tax=Roridomyces roridus TaxID=1738132 RepID=A0AAD7BVA0_9AGAR|nr:hypothetical protein FB45DRAFT_917898 [Roridomyces roridus]